MTVEQELEFYKTGLHKVVDFWTKELHPEYGPCDAFGEDGSCSACKEALDSLKRVEMKETLINLVSEIPPDTRMYRTMNNETATAQELIEGLKKDDEISKWWANDFLRVCRNMIQRQANR